MARQATTAAGPAATTNWTGVALGLCIGALAAFHQFKIPPAMPLLLEVYDYDLTIAGGFMSVYAAVGLATSALLGIGLQRFGIRRYVSIAAALFIAGSLLAIAWPAFSGVVLAARAIEGFGFAIFAVAAPVLTINSASPQHRPLAVAIFATWIPTGQLLSLGIAQPIIDANQWRLIWWIGIALTVLIVGAVWLAGRRPAASGQGANAAPPLRLGEVPWRRRIALMFGAGLFTLWSGQYFAMSTWLPQYLVEDRGIAAADAILPYAVPAAVVIIFNIICGLMLRRGVPMFPLLAGALATQGILWLFIGAFDSTWSGIAALAIYGAAAGITPTCLFSLPNTIFGDRGGSGATFGIVMTGRNLGVLMGPIILPQLILATGAWDDVGAAFGAMTLVAAGGAALLGIYMLRLNRAAQTESR